MTEMRQLHQSQYILKRCFENRENIIRVTLNNAQDYLNAVFDPSKDALRVNMAGGMLPMVEDKEDLPSKAEDGQICPVYNEENRTIDFYEWVDALGEWQYRGSTLNEETGGGVSPEEKEALDWVVDNLDKLKEVIEYNYIVHVDDIVLNPNSRIVEVQGHEQDIDDDLNLDGDTETPFRIDMNGYILSLATYADANAPVPDRYFTRVVYESGTGGLGTSHIFIEQEEYEYFANLADGKNIIRVYYLTNASTSPVKRMRLTINGDGTATDEDGETYDIHDNGDADGDAETKWSIGFKGYVLGVENFDSQDALVPDKCHVKMVYEADGIRAGNSQVYFDDDVMTQCSSLTDGKNVMDFYYLKTVFPASVTISEVQYKFPAESVDYVVIDPSGNIRNVADIPDSDGDESTHVRLSVNGYALDMDGYYTESDTVRHRLFVKMHYEQDSDTTSIYLEREHYEWVCGLGNGRNIVSVYTVGAGIGVDASRFGNSSKVHIWKGRVESYDDLQVVTAPDNGDTWQAGDKEYSWNGYEWVELGDNSENVRREQPISHVNASELTAVAGGCYRWTVLGNATLKFSGTPDTMSTTLVDIDLADGASVTMDGVTAVQQPEQGKVNRCRIEFDGSTPRLYVYAAFDRG